MVTFSANLGFLWNDRPLPDAIRAAADAGFAAVECHWPYDTPTDDVVAALDETGLPMIGLNTRRGAEGEFGLAARPGHSVEARLSIDEAIHYGAAVGARAVHVMAGVAPPQPNSFLTYIANLRHACAHAADESMTVLIEPLNAGDNPGYYLNNLADALGVLEAVDRPNLKIMFDCYHVALTEGDVLGVLPEILPHVGHIQFASVPDRAEPDEGDLDYRRVFELLDELGWTEPVGAEYRPRGAVEHGLDWMTALV